MSGISSSRQANPLNYARKEYGFYGLSGSQTTGITTNSPVKFDTCLANGGVIFNPVTYTWTLKANKTYKLTSQSYVSFNNDAGYINIRFYNATGAAYIGTTGQGIPQTYSSSKLSESPIAEAIITTSVDTDILLNINLTNSTYSTQINFDYTFVEITEIENFAPAYFNYGQYAYVSPQLTLSVTGGAGFALIRGDGIFYKTSNGTWYIKGNIAFTQTISATMSIAITGVVFKNSYNSGQAVIVDVNSTAYPIAALAQDNTGNIVITSSAAQTAAWVTFDVELDSKPTGYAIPSDV